MAKIELSENQKKVKKHVINIATKKRPNFQVLSVAGSGKSWTLRYLVKVIRKYHPGESVMVLQFNKHIKEAMEKHFIGCNDVTVSTAHAAGMAVFRYNKMKCQVDKMKYYGICREMVESNFSDFCEGDGNLQLTESPDKKETKKKKVNKLTSSLLEVVDMAMATLSAWDYDSLLTMCDKHGIIIKENKILKLVKQCIDTGITMAKNGKISFSDMIFIPVHLKLKVPKYQWVLCDEAQDFNAAQLELVIAHMAKDGRIGSFGDSRQSIMAWAGAMTDSMDQFQMKVNARQMPLSICYRCPSKVLDLARILVPEIQDRPNCPPGNVEAVKFDQIMTLAKANDYILCRLNAPLVSMCIGFIKRNVRAKVKGRDIGARLIKEYDNILDENPDVKTVDEFLGALSEYSRREITRAGIKKLSQPKIQAISDTFEALKAVGEYQSSIQRSNITNVSVIKSQITYIFAEDVPEGFITLSSFHKAKGLEADNVFLIDFDKVPFKPSKDTPFRKEDYEQEVNIIYVGITRPKENLYIQGAGLESLEDIVIKLKDVKKTLDNFDIPTIVDV